MLNKTLKQDDAIFKALDLKTINRLICTTDKGVLSLQIRKGETNYHLCLDSVPLEKELNRELMVLLFPAPKPLEVPQVNKANIVGTAIVQEVTIGQKGHKIEFSQERLDSNGRVQFEVNTEPVAIITSNIKNIKDNKDGTHTLSLKKKGRPFGAKSGKKMQ